MTHGSSGLEEWEAVYEWMGEFCETEPLQGLGLAANVGEDTFETLPRLGLRTCDALRHPPPV